MGHSFGCIFGIAKGFSSFSRRLGQSKELVNNIRIKDKHIFQCHVVLPFSKIISNLAGSNSGLNLKIFLDYPGLIIVRAGADRAKPAPQNSTIITGSN